MNQLKNSFDSMAAPAAPLFASSWVALFIVLRDGLISRNRDIPAPADSPKSRQFPTRH